MSVSTDGKLAALLIPGIKYRRFVCSDGAGTFAKELARDGIAKMYLAGTFTAPNSGVQTEQEVVSPGAQVPNEETSSLFNSWGE